MTSFLPKRLLVTGAAGFIGSNYIRYVLARDRQIIVVNLDALTYAGTLGKSKNFLDPNRHIFIKGNILDQDLVESIFRKFQIDGIVHFAAETHVDRSILGPGEFIDTNIIGTYKLLEIARKLVLEEKLVSKKKFRFHHISTDEVYGSLSPGDPPFSETAPYAPNSPYAASKASSDHLVRSYYHTYGLPALITNCSNNYGPYQFPEKFIPLLISNGLAGKPLPIYGDGNQIRDWLYVEDHCDALWLVMKNGQVGETYNIGGGNHPTNLETVHLVCDILDVLRPQESKSYYTDLIHFITDRPGHDRRYSIDSSKIKRELGWIPKENLNTGLQKTVQWYVDNQDWTANILKSPVYQSWVGKNYENR